MLTAADVRHAEPFALLRALGYPVAPVAVDAEEWRRGGVALPWNGETRFHLAVRLRDFDLFVLEGRVGEEAIGQFLRTYGKYNIATKSVLINHADNRLALYDLGGKVLRRLDVDLASPSAHAVDRLNLLAAGEEAALPRIFDRALDRESVGRQFFLRFRAAVREVAAALRASCDGETAEAIDAEALLILSRLLFLSFVQEKGWLNGERRFLVDRLAHEVLRGREWFSGVLLPLFFGCLNTPLHERTQAARRLGRIPYLNGGLFEPTLLEQRHPELHLPNELMQRVLEEVFEKFDFRLNELHGDGDPAGTHIDPEMLGKVFESLMAEGERAASGSFYTPKEVVDILTEKAIVHWLGEGEPAELLDRLDRITILDPACGSGAFLLSALGVVERLHRQYGGASGSHELRRRIVERSLFGVDLKPEAVRLCELRLWLAIVATTEAEIEDVPPLPNLDRNIMQGNSLLAPTDFLGNARADIYHDWLYALRAQQDLLERYRTASHAQRPVLARIIRGNDQRLASDLLAKAIDAAEQELVELSRPRVDLFGRSTAAADAQECRALQLRIATLQRKLRQVEEGTLDFFSFDVHFAPVLASGGFEIVTGNPPWVRNSRIESATKEMLTDRYGMFRAQKGAGTGGFHQPDLSVTFFERAVQLAAPGGVVALLLPSKILNAGYAEPLRRSTAERTTVVALDDWSDDPRRRSWFDADTFPLGVVACCGVNPPASHEIAVTAAGEQFRLPQAALRDVDEWSLVPPEVARILVRLRRTHRPLASVLGRRPFMGVKTGDNRSFFLGAAEMRAGSLVLTDGTRIPLEHVCRCVRGRDVRRWSTAASQWMLWPPVRGWKPVPRWLERFAAKRGMQPADFRLSFVRAEHVGIKVVWKDLSRGMAATVLPDEVHLDGRPFPLVPNQTLYAIDAATLEEAYVLTAVLNSIVADALLVAVAERAKDAHYRYFGRTVARLPFVVGENETLLRLARRAHLGGAVQEELDAVVARLYGVDDAELEVLRAFVTRRLGAR